MDPPRVAPRMDARRGDRRRDAAGRHARGTARRSRGCAAGLRRRRRLGDCGRLAGLCAAATAPAPLRQASRAIHRGTRRRPGRCAGHRRGKGPWVGRAHGRHPGPGCGARQPKRRLRYRREPAHLLACRRGRRLRRRGPAGRNRAVRPIRHAGGSRRRVVPFSEALRDRRRSRICEGPRGSAADHHRTHPPHRWRTGADIDGRGGRCRAFGAHVAWRRAGRIHDYAEQHHSVVSLRRGRRLRSIRGLHG